MEKLAVGVIGIGHLGAKHAKIYQEIESCELVGIYDIDNERVEKFRYETGIPTFKSIDELLDSVQAVNIVTPTITHFEIAKKAITRNIHVFIEKPITNTVEEGRELQKLADRHGVKIQVGHIERFNPALLSVKKYNLNPLFIESHRLAQFNPRGTDVAVVLDLMIHDIDVINSLINSPIESIQANGVAVVSDTIDIANARIQFKNGCVANLTASRISQKKMRKMRLFQRDAYISINFLEGSSEVFRIVEYDIPDSETTLKLGEITRGSSKRKITYEHPEPLSINPLKYELEMFLDAVINGKEPVVTSNDGISALEIAYQIIQVINQQKIPQE